MALETIFRDRLPRRGRVQELMVLRTEPGVGVESAEPDRHLLV